MRAILLAAGRGRRLGSAEPKALIDIDGRTLLERHLANMVEAGITKLTIVVGFQKEMIGAIKGTMVKVPSEHTSTAAPCFPLRGITTSTVFPTNAPQVPSNPGNCFMKATFSRLAFHFSSTLMTILVVRP